MKNLTCNIYELNKMSARERRAIVRRRKFLYFVKHPFKNITKALGNGFDLFDKVVMNLTAPLRWLIEDFKSDEFKGFREVICVIGVIAALIVMGYAVLLYMIAPLMFLAFVAFMLWA